MSEPSRRLGAQAQQLSDRHAALLMMIGSLVFAAVAEARGIELPDTPTRTFGAPEAVRIVVSQPADRQWPVDVHEDRLERPRGAQPRRRHLPMSRSRPVGNMRLRTILAALLGALSILAVGARHAEAYTTLSLHQRRQILRSADLPAPNGKTLRRATCIAGRLSTVDRRWAATYLTNTKACIRNYGGATGAATLLKRASPNSVDWKAVGEIGDNCGHGEGGAADGVLRDLGCGIILQEDRREVGTDLLVMGTGHLITPRGVGRLRLGRRAGALQRRDLIGNLRKGCEIDVDQRVAPLRAPLRGWAIFANGGHRLTSLSIEGGAETARGIGVGSTAGEARAAYPSAEWDSPRKMYPLPVGVLWVNDIDHPKFSFLVDPEAHRVESISIPNPNFCE